MPATLTVEFFLNGVGPNSDSCIQVSRSLENVFRMPIFFTENVLFIDAVALHWLLKSSVSSR